MYDLAIIGAGPAGFSAAQQAQKLKLNVALIEKDQVGGTCLNYGCIPTKALIQSAKIYSLSKKTPIFGIDAVQAKINFSEIQKRKTDIVNQLRKGMQFMLKDIAVINGVAQFLSNEELAVGDNRINAKYTVIATGSRPIQIPGLEFDNKKILSSSELLELNNIPHSLLIIGGGVIGCEFASLFSILGSQVSVVELMPHLLPQEDSETARRLEVAFRKKGIKIMTNTDAKTVNLDSFDYVLLCVGRVADPGGLNLGKIGIETEKDRIITDSYLSTNIPNIFAAGDCTGGKLLAHFAAHQGMVAVKNIVNPKSLKKAAAHLIPNCIFTDPEIASVGFTEDEAKDKGFQIRLSKFDFLGSGMARILQESDGFTELIGIITIAIQAHLKFSQLQNIIFAHPTLSESIFEAVKD